MKAPGGGCDIAGLTQDMRDIGSQYSKDKEIVKQNRAIEKQHEDLFKFLEDKQNETTSGSYSYGN